MSTPSRGPAPEVGPARHMGGRATGRPNDITAAGRRLLARMRVHRSALTGVLVFGVGSIVFNLAGPILLGRATDLVVAGMIGRSTSPQDTRTEVIQRLRAEDRDTLADLLQSTSFTPGRGVDFRTLGLLLLAALAVHTVSGLLWLLQGRATTTIIQRTVFGLRADLQAKLGRLPLPYFDRRPRGEVLSRVTNDVDNVAQALQQTMSQLTNSGLLIVGIVVMFFWISPLLAVISLLTVPMSVLVTTLVARRAQPQFAQQWRATGELSAYAEETYSGHVVVKSFGREAETVAAFRSRNDALYRSGLRAQLYSGTIQPVVAFLGNLNYVLVAVAGGLRVAAGALSIGDVQAFVQYSRQFGGPLVQVASLSNLVQSGIASAERVFELLDEEEQRTDAPPDGPVRPRGQVRFESVCFRYEPDRPLIENLSLSVAPGSTVAIVGPTGAGKTTLVNLLMRFYDLGGGRITLDGRDITDMSRAELRAVVGMVLQDTWLFRGTIAENIAYGVDGATRADVERAARAACADPFIRTLPDGYDTVVDGTGAALSAGERQLVTIARTFLPDPAVLLLDEATSSVDTRTELLIQRALARLSHGRTRFVIAHRLSTIRGADQIVVMEQGAIVERGTHPHLLAAGGPYARLYAAQFAPGRRRR